MGREIAVVAVSQNIICDLKEDAKISYVQLQPPLLGQVPTQARSDLVDGHGVSSGLGRPPHGGVCHFSSLEDGEGLWIGMDPLRGVFRTMEGLV